MQSSIDVLSRHRGKLLLAPDLISDGWESADLVARDFVETAGSWVDGAGSGEVEDVEGLGVGDFDHVVESVPWHWGAVAELVLVPDRDGIDGIALGVLGCGVVVW